MIQLARRVPPTIDDKHNPFHTNPMGKTTPIIPSEQLKLIKNTDQKTADASSQDGVLHPIIPCIENKIYQPSGKFRIDRLV